MAWSINFQQIAWRRFCAWIIFSSFFDSFRFFSFFFFAEPNEMRDAKERGKAGLSRRFAFRTFQEIFIATFLFVCLKFCERWCLSFPPQWISFHFMLDQISRMKWDFISEKNGRFYGHLEHLRLERLKTEYKFSIAFYCE